jgi:HSP20 family protein
MSLIKWQPLEELHGLRHQINQLFDQIVHEETKLGKVYPQMQETPWMPAIELQETDTDLLLKAQVPGLEPDKLDIQVSENAIFLTGEYQKEQESDHKGIVRTEFHYGQFRRVLPLPSGIQREYVTAEISDGLLTVIMPKSTASVPNVVKVPISDKSPAVPFTESCPVTDKVMRAG